jgi:replicative DNA helicase
MAKDKIEKIQIQPGALEAEKAVIGCILQDNKKLVIAQEYIDSVDVLYGGKESANKIIWTNIEAMFVDRVPIDQITLRAHLEKKGLLEKVGGTYYIMGIDDDSPSSENIVHYCKIVREKYLQRKVITAAIELKDKAYKNPDQMNAVLTRMRIESGELLDMQPGGKSSLSDITEEVIPKEDVGANIIYFENEILKTIIPGVSRGGILALGARPGNMKTTLATFIAKAYLDQDPTSKVIFFNLQMVNAEIIKKLIVMESGLSYERVRGAKSYKDFTTEELALIKTTKLHLKEKYTNLHMFDSIRSLDKIIFEINKIKPDLVIIDYIQLVRIDGEENKRKVMEKTMEDIEWESKPANSNFGTIMISQLNREIKDRFDPRPTLTDFKESGAIEEGCETAIMPFYGHSFDHIRFDDQLMYEILIRKNRFGPLASYFLGWRGNEQKFYKPNQIEEDSWNQIRNRNDRKGKARH